MPALAALGIWLWFRSLFARFLCCDVDREHFWHISRNTLLICPSGAGYDASWHWGLTTWLLSSSGQSCRKSCSLARLQTGESGCLSIELFPSPFGTSVRINATAVWLLRHRHWQLERSHTPGASVSAEVPMTPTCFLAPDLSREPDLINVMIKAGKASLALR